MRKWWLALLACAACVLLVASLLSGGAWLLGQMENIFAEDLIVTGMENFSPYLCSLELTANILPSEDFAERFPWMDSSFVYQDAGREYEWGLVRTCIVLTYAPEVYAQAKAFCMERFVLSQERQLSHGGFTFAENNTFCALHPSAGWVYPERFNLFGWRDDRCEMMFLGYYGWERMAAGMLPEDFAGFMETVYGAYYAFDEP